MNRSNTTASLFHPQYLIRKTCLKEQEGTWGSYMTFITCWSSCRTCLKLTYTAIRTLPVMSPCKCWTSWVGWPSCFTNLMTSFTRLKVGLLSSKKIVLHVFFKESHFLCLSLSCFSIVLEIRLFLNIFLNFFISIFFNFFQLGLTLTINVIFLIMETEKNFK